MRKGYDWHLKMAILPQFVTSNVHFVRKGRERDLQIAIIPRFLTSNVNDVDPQMWGYDVDQQMWGCEDVEQNLSIRNLP